MGIESLPILPTAHYLTQRVLILGRLHPSINPIAVWGLTGDTLVHNPSTGKTMLVESSKLSF